MSPWISHRFLRAQSDERLLGAAARGHGRAFEMLVERHRAALLAHARGMLGVTRAEDALQQGLLNAWIALQRGDEVRSPRAWLFRVVHNTAIDLLRGARPESSELSESLRAGRGVEADVELHEAVRDTLANVAALPEEQREALLRTALDGHSHERVGSALGVSAAAVRGLVYRARSNLRAAAGALLPAPLIAWGAGLQRRLLSMRLGAAGQGASPALLERGAAVLSAGALVAGVAAARQQIVGHSHHRHPGAALSAAPIAPSPTTAIGLRDSSMLEGSRTGSAGRGLAPGARPNHAQRSSSNGSAGAPGSREGDATDGSDQGSGGRGENAGSPQDGSDSGGSGAPGAVRTGSDDTRGSRSGDGGDSGSGSHSESSGDGTGSGGASGSGTGSGSDGGSDGGGSLAGSGTDGGAGSGGGSGSSLASQSGEGSGEHDGGGSGSNDGAAQTSGSSSDGSGQVPAASPGFDGSGESTGHTGS